MGPHHAHEVCGSPDNGKVMVRSSKQVGTLQVAPYMEGEPEQPNIFALCEQSKT
jgi:hypothetical protein